MTRASAVSAPQNSNRETFRWNLRLNDICTEHFVCLIKHKFFHKHKTSSCTHAHTHMHDIAEQVEIIGLKEKCFPRHLFIYQTQPKAARLLEILFCGVNVSFFIVRFGESMYDVLIYFDYSMGFLRIFFVLNREILRKPIMSLRLEHIFL